MKRRAVPAVWVGALVLAAMLPGTGKAQWTIPGPEGSNSYIKIGFLAQGQAEWLDKEAATHHVAQNLFIRRFRILAGGQINSNLSFFFETDTPNLGKYNATTGRKNDGDIFLQDLVLTYSFGDEFKIDGGLLLIPLSHNSEQSAATLMAIDYGAYSFVSDAATTLYTQSRVGRDYGVQLRGYLFEKHFEYRAGVYQGNRDLDTPVRNAEEAPFRYAGRIVFHFLEPEDGFFYTGTTLGKKNIFSIGASIDTQDTYHAYGADLFWDQPLDNGDAFTLQFDYIYYAGDDDGTNNPFRALYPQNDWLGEVGYYNAATKLGLFAQYSEQNFVQDNDDPADPWRDERRYQAGLAYWGQGHNFNLKAGYAVIYKEHVYKKPRIYRDQFVVQCQVFFF